MQDFQKVLNFDCEDGSDYDSMISSSSETEVPMDDVKENIDNDMPLVPSCLGTYFAVTHHLKIQLTLEGGDHLVGILPFMLWPSRVLP
jgi:hypothetical protein